VCCCQLRCQLRLRCCACRCPQRAMHLCNLRLLHVRHMPVRMLHTVPVVLLACSSYCCCCCCSGGSHLSCCCCCWHLTVRKVAVDFGHLWHRILRRRLMPQACKHIQIIQHAVCSGRSSTSTSASAHINATELPPHFATFGRSIESKGAVMDDLLSCHTTCYTLDFTA
jgi:hypothetical protein